MHTNLALFSYIVDRIFGEYPKLKLTHPVIMIGKMIDFFEFFYYKDSVLRGFFLFYFVLFFSLILGTLLSFTPIMIQIFFDAWLLASNSLYNSVKDLLQNLQNIKHLVSRDTEGLSESEIYKAGIETYAENLSDGVVAPLFYLLLFGSVGIVAYKAINTLDSMVGYKTKRYERFGKFSARVDDIVNFIPARITAIMIVMLFGKFSLFGYLSHAKGHKSPNAGYPITAMALSLGVKLGGDTKYFGEVVKKPYFGLGRTEITKDDLKEALKLQYRIDILTITSLLLLSFI